MTNQRLTTILILLMAIMPIVVTFAHYSDVVSRLSAVQIVTADEQMSDEGFSSHSDHCQPDKVHLAGCSFHVCIDCAITSSFGFAPIHGPSRYSSAERPTSVSLLAPPDIKPPIIAL